MPFGLEILTSDGRKNTNAMRSARLIFTHTTTAASGDVSVAGFDIAKGFIFQRGGGGAGFGALAFNLQWVQADGKAYWNAHQAGQTLKLMFFMRG